MPRARVARYVIERPCEQCGVVMVLVIDPKHVARKDQRFCNRTCANQSRRVVRVASARRVVSGPPTPAHLYQAAQVHRKFHLSPGLIARMCRKGVVTPQVTKNGNGVAIHWFTQRDVDVMLREAMNNTQRVRAMWTRRMRSADAKAQQPRSAQSCALCKRTALYVLPRTNEPRCAEHKTARQGAA